jgi:DNA polymerase-4
MPHFIVFLDMDAFFSAIEQQANPALKGKPVLVCGDPETRTVVAAASYEARPYGVKSGMPLAQALRLCPKAVLVEGDPPKYVDTARRLHSILLRFTPDMEVASIDEVYLELETRDPVEVARNIKSAVKTELGLTCSIGIAENKMLAKLAGGMRKPDGLMWIQPHQAQEILKDLLVAELPGIGEKTALALEKLGVRTVGELRGVPRQRLVEVFGRCGGDFLYSAGMGRDSTPVALYYEEPVIKSIGHSYTLPRDTADPRLIRAHLHRLSEMVGRRARGDRFLGRTVRLTVRTSDFSTRLKHLTVNYYLCDGADIYRVALMALRKLCLGRRVAKPGAAAPPEGIGAVRMLGVSLANLVQGVFQMGLGPHMQKRHRLLAVSDKINDKYGEFTLRPCDLEFLNREETDHMKGPCPQTLLGRKHARSGPARSGHVPFGTPKAPSGSEGPIQDPRIRPARMIA